jgi:hypothetical protein
VNKKRVDTFWYFVIMNVFRRGFAMASSSAASLRQAGKVVCIGRNYA